MVFQFLFPSVSNISGISELCPFLYPATYAYYANLNSIPRRCPHYPQPKDLDSVDFDSYHGRNHQGDHQGWNPPDPKNAPIYLEDHPMTNKWLITMVIVSPLRIGLWDPFQMAVSWLINKGDPNHLLTGMILQVPPRFTVNSMKV